MTTPNKWMSSEKKTALVPRDFLTAPLFAAIPQTGPRKVWLNDKIWEIGVSNPFDPSARPHPALDIRQGRLLFCILYLMRRKTLDIREPVPFSLNELALLYSGRHNGSSVKDIKRLINDLRETWHKITFPDGTERFFTILGTIGLEKKRNSNWLRDVSINPDFHNLILAIEKQMHIRLDVLNSIRSNLARAVYTYLPSRSVKRTERNPFVISCAKLLEQSGCKPPAYVSLQKKLFTQNKNSILSQLDGVEVLFGKLRIKMNKRGYLLSWVEKECMENKKSFYKAWVDSGRAERDFFERTRQLPQLDDYEEMCLSSSCVNLHKNMNCFRKAKALLGKYRFDVLCAEEKNYALENIRPTQTAEKRFLFHLAEAIRKF
ncbi:MAG TPA: hypothetical protein DCZ94_05725 [Lentisphaeria bacterium]|nr:MAG: hypothetical protein A2X48_07245 [Lentisphaerae bacterium GWF2_49_21]HBC86434.1 hypothetical protein [Lentisphaeria bacterium]